MGRGERCEMNLRRLGLEIPALWLFKFSVSSCASDACCLLSLVVGPWSFGFRVFLPTRSYSELIDTVTGKLVHEVARRCRSQRASTWLERFA